MPHFAFQTNQPMRKTRYYHDPETSQYLRIEPNPLQRIFHGALLGMLTIVITSILVTVYQAYFESPREMALREELREMDFYYNELDKKVEGLSEVITSIENRDDNIYRMVLGAAPVDSKIRQAGRGGYDRYAQVRKKNLHNEELIIDLNERIDRLRRKMYVESVSQDELVVLAENKLMQDAATPAISPISNAELVSIASGFGMRFHPVLQVLRMHTGLDFAAPVGTPVYATADGHIVALNANCEGYGKLIVIDHGFGYVTRYAHLNGFNVCLRQAVKRGEKIGYVGNTGVSTASHLHYEVLVNGEQMDPVHYFFDDVIPREDEKVLALASKRNQSLGD